MCTFLLLFFTSAVDGFLDAVDLTLGDALSALARALRDHSTVSVASLAGRAPSSTAPATSSSVFGTSSRPSPASTSRSSSFFCGSFSRLFVSARLSISTKPPRHRRPPLCSCPRLRYRLRPPRTRYHSKRMSLRSLHTQFTITSLPIVPPRPQCLRPTPPPLVLRKYQCMKTSTS